ncbi:unnamed protein product [marine sediment metagenome]|uniref:Uncharacterized protein n=1 Tax=marine sediment metagenome TaxID=412755 RepID=X1A582_9ZZZZ
MSEDSDQNKAWQYFQTINNALNGLLEILTMGFDKDDIIFKAGIENLKSLKETIVDVLDHDYDPKEINNYILVITRMSSSMFFLILFIIIMSEEKLHLYVKF